MSTPRKTGAGSRLRTTALALFTLAAVAAVIGLVLAVNRTEPTTATESAIPGPSQPPVITSPRPSIIPFPPVASSPADVPQAPEVPPATSPEAGEVAPAGGTGPGGDTLRRGEVRVYNNSTIRGLAARAAGDLGAAGWTVVEIGNYARGTILTTTVYYQEGTDQRADAEAIAAAFGMRVEPRFPGLSDAGPGVVVIVTNDYAR
ncbi:MAG: LytR C-terminal domain-containing protein [Pseudonocardiaceae bacterium]